MSHLVPLLEFNLSVNNANSRTAHRGNFPNCLPPYFSSKLWSMPDQHRESEISSRMTEAHEMLRRELLNAHHDDVTRERALLQNPIPVVNGLGVIKDVGIESLLVLTSIDPDQLPRFWHESLYRIGKRFGLEHTDISVQFAGVNKPARPAQGGESVSFTDHLTGTISCEVRTGGQRFLLSCCHILGDSPSPQIGKDAIWQPGYDDGGTAKDEIGKLYGFKPIDFSGSANLFDAALCKPKDPPDIQPGIRSIGSVLGTNLSPAFGTTVRKFGRKTKLRTGAVRIKKLSVLITFNQGNALFDNQYGVIGTVVGKNFAELGDSGSLVVDDKTAAIGLAFAVASGTDLTYVNPIEPIINHFNITIP
jgi:hypothetical protein